MSARGFKDRYGPTALVAGASEGLGAAYAHALAARGLDLFLVARRKEPLQRTAAEIASKSGVKVQTLSCDLGHPEAPERIIEAIGPEPIDFLVYNAARSYIGPFLGTEATTHTGIVDVNIQTPLKLLHYFGGRMVERRRGGIVLMASLAGFQGSGNLSAYAASKAFDRVLAEGLWYEWGPYGVDVIACCAGATETPNFIHTNPGKASRFEPRPLRPEEVAEECLRRIGTAPSFITGRGNRFASFLMQHIFPRKIAIRIMGDGLKKMYRINPFPTDPRMDETGSR